ncbi:terminase small subunit [Caproicibacterium amylolyticum]|uniref:Terminase small subunit n=1 Tax=Caproicibacterium amylolyticum TaxID=2766537 RepID=A0A7G9WF83_9FIRM|nr:terminase small subunit [Caproicibacterium amylolyticum]QNO17345.1 terminase small subunit [Caproicibacterium amylolyticum]
MAITEKQKRFADEYLKDLNATAAARRAGYKDPNFGRQLLTKTNVSEYIQKRMQAQQSRTEITQDRVLQELAAIGFARGTDYAQVTKSGAVAIKPTDQLNDQQKAAVTGIKETQAGVEVKLADKVKALELLGKHLGMFDGASQSADIEDLADLRKEVFGK